jgi:hypothetical protein
MIGELTAHLWQSTWFALAAGLLTIAFRKSRAKVRYGLWLSASFKFLIPFWPLMSLGSHLEWAPAARTIATPAVSLTVSQFNLPGRSLWRRPRKTRAIGSRSRFSAFGHVDLL